MNSTIIWGFAFNVIVNSLFAFFSVALIVELFLFVFRFKEARVKAWCRTLPFIKVCVDLFLYNFSAWVMMHGLNPLESGPGTRILTAYFNSYLNDFYPFLSAGIQMLLKEGQTFTPADLMIFSVDFWWIKLIVLIALTGSVLLTIKRIGQLFASHRNLSLMIQNAKNCPKRPENPKLLQLLEKYSVRIVLSSEIYIPCALGFWRKIVIIPECLIDRLTQTEFEAIIAHEAAHLRCFDAGIRVFSQLVQTFFWWIPMRNSIGHLELSQEIACDQSLSKFGIPRIALARAIVKSIKMAKSRSQNLPLICFVNKNQVLSRLKVILNESKNPRCFILRLSINFLVACIMLTLLSGKFWIF